MAEPKASLIIELVDKVSGGVKTIRDKISDLKTSLFAVGAAIAAVTAFLVQSLKAYAENEAAVNKLNTALKNQGTFTTEVSNDLKAYAEQLARQTTFTNEAILSAEALFATFGLGADDIKKATQMAANLSATLGIDLHQAAMLVGKALQGNEGALSRFGLSLADVEKMGGAAAAQLNTIQGRMLNLSNRVNELQEDIGGLLVPAFEFLADKMEKVVDAAEHISDTFKNLGVLKTFGMAAIEIFRMIGDAVFQLIGIIPGLGRASESLARKFNASLDTMQAKMQANIQVDDAVTAKAVSNTAIRSKAMEEEVQKALEKSQALLLNFQSEQEQLAVLKEFYGATEAQMLNQFLTAQEAAELTSQLKRLEQLGRFADAKKLKLAALDAAERQQALKLEEFKKEQEKIREANFESSLNKIAVLATAKNKALAAIGKAAAISMATIDTFAAANKALASAPPPFNFALAAAVTAAGLFNVAKISGIELAEGGIVMPRPGGVQATIGEAGRPEAVIPLNDDRARQMLGDNAGGSTIVIQAGVIVADKLSVKEFAKQIDEQLYTLRRQRESVAFD